MRKFLLYLLFGFLTIATAVGSKSESLSHNVAWGARGLRDIHLRREIIVEKAKLLRVISTDYEFLQKPDKFPYPRTITQIFVTDQYTNGNGGYATLKNGGPGTDSALIHLKSQRGHGLNFTIDIFGQ